MSASFTIIIPARYASTRLPGKPLLDIKGKPLIQHVFEIAKSSNATQIYIATDNNKIADAAQAFGAEIVMTSEDHQSGTDRIAEVIDKKKIKDDEIIVNLQGDEFNLPVSLLNQVAAGLANNPEKHVATLCERIKDIGEYKDPNAVKVVFDDNNSAIYFSRSPIPMNRSNDLPDNTFRHIGLYAYSAAYVKRFTKLAPSLLEQTEALEQLRSLYYGDVIHIEIAEETTGIGIDTEEDLALARSL